MTLDPTIQVPMPKTGVTTRSCRGCHPVYKLLKSCQNEKGAPTSKSVCIGKLDTDTGNLIPNSNFRKAYADEPSVIVCPRPGSIRNVGGTFAIGSIMDGLGLKEVLDETLGVERSSLARTAAIYMVARSNDFEGVLDYCEGFTLGEAALSSQTASELFKSISHDERMEFFRLWAAKNLPAIAWPTTWPRS